MADLDPSQSTLSPNFAPYIYDYLSRGQAAANLPFQPYTGQRFAGISPLQSQAFSGLAGLQTPGQFQTATNMLTQAGLQAQGMGYSPTQFGSFYQAPQTYQPSGTPSYGQVGAQGVYSQYQAPTPYQPTYFQNQFQAPSAYQPQTATSGYQAPTPYQGADFTSGFSYQGGPATQFTNQYQAPSAYQAADFTQGVGGQSYGPTQFQTGLGPVKSVQDYMSQYTGGVSDIAAREVTRQADVSRQAEQARLAQAGAYGGSRQAIMEAERQRNLGQQIGDIRTKGLQEAFENAQKQRLAEAGLGMEAQKATELSKQFGATFGQQGIGQLLQARKMGEESRQFSAQQEATARDMQAKYGLSTQQAQEAARQFNAGQALTAEQLRTQFGMDAQKAEEMSRQFGATQAAQAAETGARLGLQAQQQTAAERQFGATQALQAKDLQARYGLSADQAAEASRQFASGQQMTAAEISARFGLDAQKANQMAQQQAQVANQNAALEAARQAEASRQYGYGQQMTAADRYAQYMADAQRQAEQSKQFGAQYGMDALRQQQAIAQALAGVGTSQFGTQLQGLESLLRAGQTQRDIAQQPLDFGYQQFQESLKYPMQQAQFMQSLIQGLPPAALAARQYDPGVSGLQGMLGGGLGALQLFNMLFGGGQK